MNYAPPNPIPTPSTFNYSYFQDLDESLTLSDADSRYLKKSGDNGNYLILDNYLSVARTINGESISATNGITRMAINCQTSNCHIGTTSNHNLKIKTNNLDCCEFNTSQQCIFYARPAVSISNNTTSLISYTNWNNSANSMQCHLYMSNVGTTFGTSTAHPLRILSNNVNVIVCDTSNNVNIPSHNGSTTGLQLAGNLVTATAAELNYNDINTIGVAQASKALVVDANRNLTNLNYLEINRTNNNNYLRCTDGTCNLDFFINSSNIPSIGTSTNHGLGFFTANGSSNQLFLSNTSSRVGVGLNNPSFQFQVSTDSAAKPSTNTWTISSDERIKEDIKDADLDICYNNVKSLKLKKYKYIDKFIDNHSIEDKSKLGWIAQDVKKLIPKSVSISNNEDYGIEDFHSLNTDQIIACLYGAVQKLIHDVEKLSK